MEQEEGDQHIQPELPGGASITPQNTVIRKEKKTHNNCLF